MERKGAESGVAKLPYQLHAESERPGPRGGRHRMLSPEGPLGRAPGEAEALVTRGWLSPPWPRHTNRAIDEASGPFPFDLVLRLDEPAQLLKVIITADVSRRPTRVEVLAGLVRPGKHQREVANAGSSPQADGTSPFSKHRLRVVALGEVFFNADDGFELFPKQTRTVSCDVHMCAFLKLRVHGCHPSSSNPLRQAGFEGITLVGRAMAQPRSPPRSADASPPRAREAPPKRPLNLSSYQIPESPPSPAAVRAEAARGPQGLGGVIAAPLRLLGGSSRGLLRGLGSVVGGIGNVAGAVAGTLEAGVRNATGLGDRSVDRRRNAPPTYDEMARRGYVPKRAWELSTELRSAAGVGSPLEDEASVAAEDMEAALRHERALLLTRKDKPVLDENDNVTSYTLPAAEPGLGDATAAAYADRVAAQADQMSLLSPGKAASEASEARARAASPSKVPPPSPTVARAASPARFGSPGRVPVPDYVSSLRARSPEPRSNAGGLNGGARSYYVISRLTARSPRRAGAGAPPPSMARMGSPPRNLASAGFTVGVRPAPMGTDAVAAPGWGLQMLRRGGGGGAAQQPEVRRQLF